MTFSDKNRVKSRNPCFFLSKKSVLNRGLCWLKLCYPGTPCTVVFECPLWNSNFERSLAKVMPNATKPKCKGRLGFPLKANIHNLHCFAKVFINLLNLHSKVKQDWKSIPNCEQFVKNMFVKSMFLWSCLSQPCLSRPCQEHFCQEQVKQFSN